MIIANCFEGDDEEVARKQHHVYGHALEIIISTCNRHVGVARAILQTSVRPEWCNVKTCDHRTLQAARDRLAMVWRSQNDFRQCSLLSDDNKTLDDVQSSWLSWLIRETEDWYNFPHLISLVQTILLNQNNRSGYLAETELSLAILERFPQAPWRHGEHEMFQESLEKYRE